MGRRHHLAWSLSNTLDAEFCVEVLEGALGKDKPEVFNTDQGSQFTGEGFTGLLEEHGVRISMDGKGRYRDNIFVERLWRTVKYDEVYLKAYENGREAKAGMDAHVFMPKDAPLANQTEVTIMGAHLTLVDGLIGDAGRLSRQKAQEDGLFDVSTLQEPYRVEGKKTMGYEIAEQDQGRALAVLLLHQGAGDDQGNLDPALVHGGLGAI